MTPQEIIKQLEKNRAIFEILLKGLTEEEYLWKQHSDKWCMLEIVRHLIDEENEDWRKRTKHILEQPKNSFDPIDPVGWVKERAYLSKDYNESVIEFLSERTTSLNWLKSLDQPNWQNVHQHPHFGPMTAMKFLSNWGAHDFLHIKQISRLKYDYLSATTGEDISYAGEWK